MTTLHGNVILFRRASRGRRPLILRDSDVVVAWHGAVARLERHQRVFARGVGLGRGVARAADKLEVQIRNARKDRIIHAVSQLADRYRVRYGLPFFLRFDPDTGAKNYDMSVILRNGRLTADVHALHSFRTGGKNAFADYAEPEVLEKTWKREVLSLAGLSPEELNPSERRFFDEQVIRQMAVLKSEVMEVQTLAAASLQEHLAQNPKLVRDPAIRALLVKLKNPVPDTERDLWIAELSVQLKKYVYEELRKLSGVPMLVNLK